MRAKGFLTGFCVLLLPILLSKSGYAIDPNTIIGQWHFDDGSGKVAKDSSGNGNDGSLVGDTKWVDGKSGKALLFDGQNDCVTMPVDRDIPDEFTLSAWIYQESEAKSPGDDGDYGQTILSSSNVANNYSFWLLTYRGEQIRFYAFETAPAVGNSLLTNDKVISLGQWHHIAATAVKGQDSVIYVDGEEKARMNNKGLETTSTGYFVGDLRVDRQIAFNGIIDEVTVFDVALSPADIAILAKGGKAVSPPGKLALTWGFIKNQ